MAKKPNILFFHVDNLGMGELGCYGGGILRGADTKRMDTFAKQGVKLTLDKPLAHEPRIAALEEELSRGLPEGYRDFSYGRQLSREMTDKGYLS